MLRILVETSLPSSTIDRVRAGLAALGPAVAGRVEVLEPGSGCQRPACGGEVGWTPCWLSLELSDRRHDAVGKAVRSLKALVADACREGGMELYVLPANAQIDDGFYRLRDVLDAAERIP